SESAIGACASAPRGWACPRGSPPSGGPAPGCGGLSPSRGPASVDRGLPPRVGLPPRAGLPPRVGPASAACAACSPFLRWLPRSSVVSYGLKRALRGTAMAVAEGAGALGRRCGGLGGGGALGGFVQARQELDEQRQAVGRRRGLPGTPHRLPEGGGAWLVRRRSGG